MLKTSLENNLLGTGIAVIIICSIEVRVVIISLAKTIHCTYATSRIPCLLVVRGQEILSFGDFTSKFDYIYFIRLFYTTSHIVHCMNERFAPNRDPLSVVLLQTVGAHKLGSIHLSGMSLYAGALQPPVTGFKPVSAQQFARGEKKRAS